MPDDDRSLVEQARAELARQRETHGHVEVEAATTHAGIEVGVERRRWKVVGSVRYYWDAARGWVAGAKVRRDW